MDSCATFCNLLLSTSVNPVSEHSLISLDWVLTAGIPAPQSVTLGVLTLPSGNTMCSMHMKLSVTTGLSYDLVLSRDWLFFCRQTLLHVSFHLSSGIVHPGRQPSARPSHLVQHPSPTPMDLDPPLLGLRDIVDTSHGISWT
ncbi:hypothetical protein MVEN_02596700 [Mycena venus]|uniref:Uncharacterized protein n=1 Tax=Mycena venus TaxID=2733690 RepID=A0A8H6TZT7_9AGAR|nr:hypothetical protein MVEN_02596700 [Mycena venus]